MRNAFDIISEINGEQVLRRMYHRSVRANFSGAFTIMLNTAADGMIISHFLGMRAAAAFGLIVPLYSLINLIPVLLRTATQLNLGEDLGRGDLEKARSRIFSMLIAGLAASIPFLLLFTLFRGSTVFFLSAFAGHAEETAALAKDYLLWFAPSMFPMMISPVLHPIMQLDGDMHRSPLAIQAATVVNLLGDLLCVLVFHGGLGGIAAATTLSCYTELLVLCLHFRKKEAALKPLIRRGFRFERTERGAFSKGVPIMLRELTAFLTGILLNFWAFRLAGEDLVAALAIGNSVWAFLLAAATAVSGAEMTLGSVAWGEADHHALRTVLRMGLWYALVPCSVYAFVFVLLSEPAAQFCSGGNARLLSLSLPLLRCFAISLPAAAFCQVLEGHLNVIGDLRRSALVNVLDGGICWLAAVWLLLRNTGVSGIWAGRPLGEFALALFLAVILLSRGRNTRKENPDAENGEKASAQIEATLYTAEDAAVFSGRLHDFCLENGSSARISYLSALCLEELACNTLKWGYNDDSAKGLDVRAAYDKEEIILRFRDDGRRFNPEEYASQILVSDRDPSKNVGLRIVSGLASEMRYTCLADCNVLYIRIK